MGKQQRMVVLGLLSIGMRYGWEMEKFADDTRMRDWTPIGMSTIYKVLKDLAREGLVEVQKEPSGKGPARVAYALTAEGRQAFIEAISSALRSQASVYSERIAALVFLPSIRGERRDAALADCDRWLAEADELLQYRAENYPGDPIAGAIIDFYREVYAAERRALARIGAVLQPS